MSAAETASAKKNDSNANLPQLLQRKWFADVLVIAFCVSGALFSLNLFRLDLFQSIASQNKKPMGTVTVKYNNVQRRFSDRVLWGRLTVDSPVYSGDLIRVAGYSAATLDINDGVIDINENSLIRIHASSDGEDRVVIDLNSGSLSITCSDAVDKGVTLNVMGCTIAPTAKTTLSVSAKESGMTVQVNEGIATITGDGYSRSVDTGEALILDTEGVEQTAPSAVVILPHPNARFIKNSVEPVNVRFMWNTLNIDQRTRLRLEIAAGYNFTRIVQTADGVDSANVSLGAGTWYWRLSYQDAVLSSGQFTIVDAAMSAPVCPIQNSLFNYKEKPPSVRFEWQPVEGASYYILEASLAPDMINPSIIKQTAVASYVEPVMEAGTWYWRVKPVFPSLYEGSAVFSQASSFRVERIDESAAAAQTADNPPVIQALSEPEPIPAAAPKSVKSDKSAKPATPPASAVKPNSSISKPETVSDPVTPPVSNTAASADPVTTPGVFVSSTAGWKALFDMNSKSNINIAKETIDGAEREVLTINITLAGGDSKWAGATLTDEAFFAKVLIGQTKGAKSTGTAATDMNLIQKLMNADGIRFKVLGDGKKWRVYFPTSNVTDGAYHGVTISTQNGQVSVIDISFNKLDQPNYGTRIRFNKNNLKGITIERNGETPGSGASAIKVFDFEVF